MTNAPTSASGSGPVMRGLHSMQTKRQLAIGVALTACVVVGVKILNNDPRKKAYAEFYKNYDAEKSFERMRAKGLFQSC